MTKKKYAERLDLIEKALTAKGHPMQDFSTIKMAVLDLIGVVRGMLAECGEKHEGKTGRKRCCG